VWLEIGRMLNKRSNVIKQDAGKDKEIWENVTNKLLPLEVSIEENFKQYIFS
jgi:hypothetical protein